MAPLISCVVSMYNGRRYITQALDSIFDQTYRPIEVIVADDGSTDGSPEIAAEYSKPVRLLTQNNKGPSATRNFGLAHAQGDWIAFLDADDLWHSEKLERQAKRLMARPELQFSVTHVQMFWEAEVSHEQEKFKGHLRAQPVPGYATISLLARREVFDIVGRFSPELWYADATDWFIRAREKRVEMELLAETLVYHRMHGNNLTRRGSQASCAEFARVIKASLDRRRA
jgi:glycosyltransferase involved in cell wall biosynthesis